MVDLRRYDVKAYVAYNKPRLDFKGTSNLALLLTFSLSFLLLVILICSYLLSFVPSLMAITFITGMLQNVYSKYNCIDDI